MDMKLQLNSYAMKTGDRLKIERSLQEGIVPDDPCRFIIDLGRDANNLALYVSIRFDEDAVVLNTRTDGTWDEEERISPLPLKNEEVKIVIKLLGDKFEVDFPGKRGVTFPNRLDMNNITYVCVHGDFKLTSFEII